MCVSTISETSILVTDLVFNLSSHQELNVIPEALTLQCDCYLQGVGIWHNTYSQMDKQ